MGGCMDGGSAAMVVWQAGAVVEEVVGCMAMVVWQAGAVG